MAADLVPLCVEKLVKEEATEIRVSLVLFIIHKGPAFILAIVLKPFPAFKYGTLTESGL